MKKRPKTKQQLVRLYIGSLSEKMIRKGISAIIRDFRPNASKYSRIITKKEFEEFVAVYGEP